MRKKSKIYAIESGSVDRIPPPQNTRKARNSLEFRAKSVAGAEGFEPSARGFGEQVESRLSSVQHTNIENIKKINTTLENKMKELQESNENRLEQMQGVVDEKLQKTLETRLSQSFELVSKQLESVGQGLGEMKALAADAKSLKNALTNVKERGTYGEVRLEKLLSDILAPSQYEMNVEIASGKRVEFAIKLPGNVIDLCKFIG